MPQKQSAVILAGGEPPLRADIEREIKRARIFICADGGANTALRLKLTPDVIIGDFDSVRGETLRKFASSDLIRVAEQETTDLEKALNYCVNVRHREVHIFGALGLRADHAAASLGLFVKYGQELKLRVYDSFGVISSVTKSERLNVAKGQKLSLIPLRKCRGVRTRGLKFPLRRENLELGVREGISNEALSKRVEISLDSGLLLLYRWRETHTPKIRGLK